MGPLWVLMGPLMVLVSSLVVLVVPLVVLVVSSGTDGSSLCKLQDTKST